MGSIMMEPTAAVSAAAEPEIPAKITLVRISTMPRPPVRWPIRAWAKSTRRREMPPLSISSPESMKKGMAIKLKELTPENNLWATTESVVPSTINPIREPSPMAKAMGTPANRRIKKITNAIVNIVILLHPPLLFSS